MLREETCSYATLRALSTGALRFFIAQTIIKNIFFLNYDFQLRSTVRQGSTIFDASFDLYCPSITNLASKLTLNSAERVPQFGERQRIRSCLYRTGLACTECVQQYRESIHRCSAREREGMRSHPALLGMGENYF